MQRSNNHINIKCNRFIRHVLNWSVSTMFMCLNSWNNLRERERERGGGERGREREGERDINMSPRDKPLKVMVHCTNIMSTFH